jgi:peptidoglycan/LPS O-acetylase OafA/YrhL
LDAVRAGALLLGVVFHSTLSFLQPRTWEILDIHTSSLMDGTYYVIHIFRMTVFFFIAGFFARILLHRRGRKGFIRNRAKRIAAPFVIFWPIVMVTTVMAIVLGAAVAGEDPPGAESWNARTFPLTHLWFLYWLMLLYVGALVIRAVVQRLDRDGQRRARLVDPAVAWVVRSGWTPVIVGAPLAIAFFLRSDWLKWYGVPAAEDGFIPSVAGLVAYGTAFAFGWLMQRQPNLLQVWEQHRVRNLIAAVVLTVLCLLLAGSSDPEVAPSSQDGELLLYAFLYTLAIWTWTTGLIGLALRYLSAPNANVRYVADASYWIYIAHLPVIMFLQAAVSQLSIPWYLKYLLILAVAFPLLLLSYRYLVRYTFIGALLNGRKVKDSSKIKPKSRAKSKPEADKAAVAASE